MSLRLATFNIENLLTRFDFTGFRNQTRRDRAIQLFDIRDEATYQALESARMVSSTDDTRQLSALAIADADADILCLQEVDNMAALQAFEYGYLYRMVGNGYLQKYLVEGNDSRGIDVAVVMREETRDGEKIEVVDIKSHAALTYRNLDLFNPALAATNQIDDKIFKRDCLEIDLRIGGKPLTLYVTHFKSMTNAREALDARLGTMPIREAEAMAVRRIIENRWGAGNTRNKNFAICGDMNDYQERVAIAGDRRNGYSFTSKIQEVRSMSSLPTISSSIRCCVAMSWTAGRSIIPGGRRSSICASLITSGFPRAWLKATRRGFPKSSAPASLIAPSFRRGRRWTVIRALAGTAPRLPIIALS